MKGAVTPEPLPYYTIPPPPTNGILRKYSPVFIRRFLGLIRALFIRFFTGTLCSTSLFIFQFGILYRVRGTQKKQATEIIKLHLIHFPKVKRHDLPFKSPVTRLFILKLIDYNDLKEDQRLVNLNRKTPGATDD